MTARPWRTGTLAITGADGHVGRHLQHRLAGFPNPVRPLSQEDDWRTGVADAEAVIHLAGTLQPRRPNTYEVANVGTVRRLTETLSDSAVQRVVLLSYAGADPDSANAYLRTKGEAEELIRRTGIPAVILRATFIYGDPDDIGPSFASYQGKTVSVLGDGTQKLAPLHVDYLTEILVAAALDPEAPVGTFEVGGPDIVTIDQFVQQINRDEVRIRHLSPTMARLLARIVPSLTPALVDVLLADSLPAGDPTETAARFEVSVRHRMDGMAT